MANRYNAKSKSTSRFGVSPLNTGYELAGSPEDFYIPSVGIEDTDKALFNLFDKELPLNIENSSGVKRVPIVFAAGEKWALLRNATPRDKVGSLILPSIVIGRTSIDQSDTTSRGINQNTGTINIKRRLDKTDRNYQSWINRLNINNQLNVAVASSDAINDQITTTRNIADLELDGDIIQGGYLKSNRKNNIFETIVIPQPQFYVAMYEVTVWTQYVQQMNSIVESLISSFLPQGNQWRLETEKGYWFVATVENNSYNSQNNFDDYSKEERTIKYQFNIKVPAYILASDKPGQPVAIKRYVSNPEINFSIASVSLEESFVEGDNDPFLGADDPTLQLTTKFSRRDDQRNDNRTKLYPNNSKISVDDPALKQISRNREISKYRKVSVLNKNGSISTKHIQVKTVNQHSGETVFSSNTNLGGINIKDIVKI